MWKIHQTNSCSVSDHENQKKVKKRKQVEKTLEFFSAKKLIKISFLFR